MTFEGLGFRVEGLGLLREQRHKHVDCLGLEGF